MSDLKYQLPYYGSALSNSRGEFFIRVELMKRCLQRSDTNETQMSINFFLCFIFPQIGFSICMKLSHQVLLVMIHEGPTKPS